MKTELLKQIATVVSQVCDISVAELCGSGKQAELIEARTIFIWECNKYGFYAGDIAKFLNRKRTKSIYDYLANFRIYKQSSVSFRLLVLETDKILSEVIPKA